MTTTTSMSPSPHSYSQPTTAALLRITDDQAKIVEAIFHDGRPRPVVRAIDAIAIARNAIDITLWSEALTLVRTPPTVGTYVPLRVRRERKATLQRQIANEERRALDGLAEAHHVTLWVAHKARAARRAQKAALSADKARIVNDRLVHTTGACALLGISRHAFLRLRSARGIDPVVIFGHGHPRSWYARIDIECLALALVSRRPSRGTP